MQSSTINMDERVIAKRILDGFNYHFEHFQQITGRAQLLFESAQWAEIHRQSLIRLDYYKSDVLDVIRALQQAGASLDQVEAWPDIRQEYQYLIESLVNRELAETFYNSVYCCIFDHRQITNAAMFVNSSSASCYADIKPIFQDIIFTHDLVDNFEQLIEAILDEPGFAIPYENKTRDIENIVAVLTETLLADIAPATPVKLEILKSLFFRNKGTYIVGRLVHDQCITPFVIPIINNEQGAIYADAVIYEPDDVSIIFSFTRSYFMVEAPVPAKIVAFLATLVPQKGLAELYNAIGLNKHGKTEFYRSFIEHLERSEDKFVLAPGIKGMVMSVFTMS